MQAVLAELSRTKPLPSTANCESSANESNSADPISSRGLEILRILNEVFNGLPGDVSVGTNDRYLPRT